MKIFIYFIVSANERKLIYFKKSMKFLKNLPANFRRLFNASFSALRVINHCEKQCIENNAFPLPRRLNNTIVVLIAETLTHSIESLPKFSFPKIRRLIISGSSNGVLLQEDAGRPAKRIFSQFPLSLPLSLDLQSVWMISRDSRIHGWEWDRLKYMTAMKMGWNDGGSREIVLMETFPMRSR